jgi:hypothetical protein
MPMPNNSDVQFKFSQPSGAPSRKPSASMTVALGKLSESTELRSLVAEAQAQGRKVVVQVYHSSDGHPFLIHLKAVPQDAA